MPSRDQSSSKSFVLFPAYGENWKEYEDLYNLRSACKLKTWESMWYKEEERDYYHYDANMNEPRTTTAENPNVGDSFDATIFIFLIVMVIVPYIYAICNRRKHLYVPKEIPIVSYHYRVGRTKRHRHSTKHSDINIADLQNQREKPSFSSSVRSYGGESICSAELRNHPDVVNRGSLFMAGGIVLRSEKHTKAYEEEPSCLCGPCYRIKKESEKKKKISKNKVAPLRSSDRTPSFSEFSSSSSSQLV